MIATPFIAIPIMTIVGISASINVQNAIPEDIHVTIEAKRKYR